MRLQKLQQWFQENQIAKLVNPFAIKEDQTLEPWLLNVTKDDIFMISSDKILTLAEPTPPYLKNT